MMYQFQKNFSWYRNSIILVMYVLLELLTHVVYLDSRTIHRYYLVESIRTYNHGNIICNIILCRCLGKSSLANTERISKFLIMECASTKDLLLPYFYLANLSIQCHKFTNL